MLFLATMLCRFVVCHLALLAVGLGSSLFHLSLKFPAQLMDEIPMVWSSAAFIYSLAMVSISSFLYYVWLH